MFWKFLKLQRLLDDLFDEGWCLLGIPENCESIDATLLIDQ